MTRHRDHGAPAAGGRQEKAGEQVTIFDTTLRDGEQAPGFSMDHDQKMRMARALAELGVDVIEAGYPAASPGDFQAVEAIAREVEGVTVCGLARANEGDIRAVARAIAPAERQRIHVFIATSPVHRRDKLKMDRTTVLERAVAAVRQARELVAEVEFSAEDALRTEPEFLVEIFSAAIDAGARIVNVPDTVGYATPADIGRVFRFLREQVKGADKVVFSAHCHDDLGLAVCNSLAAVEAGARQVEVAMNGIGERAGNCALEELVMALKTRADFYGVSTGINTRRLYATSRLLASITGQPVPRNKAIVGDNAFAHESGIHQDGVLKNVETYEIMRPEDVGVPASSLVLGKHSGRHAFARRVTALGYSLEGEELDEAFRAFKNLADRKKLITNADIEGIILGREVKSPGPWSLQALQVAASSGEAKMSTAAVSLVHSDGRAVQASALASGPVEAVFAAIRSATGTDARLLDFSVRSIGAGSDAQGWADVHLAADGRTAHGSGVDTDIVAASAAAYLDALNRLLRGDELPSDSALAAPAGAMIG
ncbi:MAG: 2-isopropylmalate synthase [Alphaproteobacteria bacterium]|nr:MAG: 2-isopropylmalate synthase [Alphaproteobacteria bacterium]